MKTHQFSNGDFAVCRTNSFEDASSLRADLLRQNPARLVFIRFVPAPREIVGTNPMGLPIMKLTGESKWDLYQSDIPNSLHLIIKAMESVGFAGKLETGRRSEYFARLLSLLNSLSFGSNIQIECLYFDESAMFDVKDVCKTRLNKHELKNLRAFHREYFHDVVIEWEEDDALENYVTKNFFILGRSN